MNRREFVASAIAAAGLGGIVVASEVEMPKLGGIFVLKYPAGNEAARRECSVFAAELSEHYGCRVMFMPNDYDIQYLTRSEAAGLVKKLVEVRPVGYILNQPSGDTA